MQGGGRSPVRELSRQIKRLGADGGKPPHEAQLQSFSSFKVW